LMLDAYSTDFQRTNEWGRAVSCWNVVQAILRNVSCRVDSAFLAVQTSSVLVFLSFAAGILRSIMTNSGDAGLDQHAWAVLQVPSMMIALTAFILFVKAAGVTETCMRIPPVMNSVLVTVDNSINRDRQYLVSDVLHSQAGFRVKGTLITGTLLMNYCYLCGAIICGLFTTGLSLSRKP